MRKIIQGIKSLWYWLPIIWKWDVYDYHFTLMVFHHSLKGLYKFLASGGCQAIHNPKKIQRLKVTLLLLERVLKDNYHDLCRDLDEPYYLSEQEFFLIEKNYDDWHYLAKQDWHTLWEYIEKYMQVWWD